MADRNTITLTENGPLLVSGDINILNAAGEVMHQQTDAALCRCGESSNKPFCDGSHGKAGFECSTADNAERLEAGATTEEGGPLSIKLFANGPAMIEGTYELVGEDDARTNTNKKMSFCRCGATGNGPFCDGSHKPAGFTAD